jgi:hypothetical protein
VKEKRNQNRLKFHGVPARPPIMADLEVQRGPALADRRCTSAHSPSLTGYSTGQTSHVANRRPLSRHPSASTCSAPPPPPPPLKRRRPPRPRCRLLRCPRRRQRTGRRVLVSASMADRGEATGKRSVGETFSRLRELGKVRA